MLHSLLNLKSRLLTWMVLRRPIILRKGNIYTKDCIKTKAVNSVREYITNQQSPLRLRDSYFY